MKTLLFKPNSLRVQLTLALAGAVLFGALTPRLLAALWSTTDGSSPDLVSMLLAVTLFLTVALVLSRLLAQTLLAPLEALAQASEKITADTPEMAPVPVTTELLPMVQAINTLALTDARNTHEAAVAARTQALAASETRLNHVINASAEGFWDWDLSCNRVQINPRCGQLLGLPAGIANGRVFAAVDPVAFGDEASAGLQALMRAGWVASIAATDEQLVVSAGIFEAFAGEEILELGG
jgi:PAS domain-containing protein